MNKRNIKIEVNENQPLDEIVRELERLGYRCYGYLTSDDICILAQDDGYIIGCDFEVDNKCWKLTTLTELKEM